MATCKINGAAATARLREFFTSRNTWLCLASVVIMAVIAFAYFYPDAAEGNVLLQSDTRQGIANGHEAKTFEAATGEQTRWTNSLFSGMPTFQISPDYPSNHLFNWINTVMGLGLPSPANLLLMMMLGFFILGLAMKMRWWVALIGAIGYGFSSYFLIIIGAGHIWKFITLAYIPPTIAGIVMAYRGRYLAGAAVAALFAMMQIQANHVQMTYYFLFVVAGFMVAYLIADLRAGRMVRWGKATGVLAVSAALAVCANLPGLYNTYEYSKETIRGGHSELTPAAAAGPNASTGLDRDYITQYSYQPSETFSLLIPDIKGGASARISQGKMVATSLADLEGAPSQGDPAGQYLTMVSQYFGDPEGTNGPVYVGALIFSLFLLGIVIVRGPLKWVLAILTILSIFLAWGRHFIWFTDLFIDYIPMYAKFRTVESILVIAGFTMPLLAAMALQKIFTTPKADLGRMTRPLAWTMGIAAFFCVVALLSPSLFGPLVGENDYTTDSYISQMLLSQGYDAQTAALFSLRNPDIYNAVVALREGLVRSDALRSLIIVLLGGGLLIAYALRRLSLAVTATGVGLVIFFDLFMVNKRYLSHDSFVSKTLQAGPPIAKIPADDVISADTTAHFRVMDLPRFDSPDGSYYHKMLGGYHAAKLTRYNDIIERHLHPFVAGDTAVSHLNVVNMLNARYFIGGDGQAYANPEAFGNAWLVDTLNYVADADNEMAALDVINPRRVAVADKKFAETLGNAIPASPGDTIRLTTYAPNRLTYHASTRRGGVAVFSEVYFPWGWRATVDGKPVDLGRADYILRAMRIPAGEHTIEMTFDPPSLHTTVTLARVAVWLIYTLCLAALAGALICRCKCAPPSPRQKN